MTAADWSRGQLIGQEEGTREVCDDWCVLLLTVGLWSELQNAADLRHSSRTNIHFALSYCSPSLTLSAPLSNVTHTQVIPNSDLYDH